MTQQRYRLRISGLGEDEGQIKVTTFQRVLNALLKTAERTARLLATGAGSEKGAKPRWLAATMDMTIAGLSAGSTIVEVVAPPIGETARDAFAQFDLWDTTPQVEDTALDLLPGFRRKAAAFDPPISPGPGRAMSPSTIC